MSFKGAIAITQEHASVIGAEICGDDVEFTISINITQGYGVWSSSCGVVYIETKSTIAKAQEYAGAIGIHTAIRGDDVEFAIAIHIPQGHGIWQSSRGVVYFGTKSTIANA